MTRAQSTPGVPEFRERTHVVYDGATGSILHVHHSVEFEGVRESENPAARALRWAGSKPGAKVVEADRAEPMRGRRVDIATGRLTEG